MGTVSEFIKKALVREYAMLRSLKGRENARCAELRTGEEVGQEKEQSWTTFYACREELVLEKTRTSCQGNCEKKKLS